MSRWGWGDWWFSWCCWIDFCLFAGIIIRLLAVSKPRRRNFIPALSAFCPSSYRHLLLGTECRKPRVFTPRAAGSRRASWRECSGLVRFPWWSWKLSSWTWSTPINLSPRTCNLSLSLQCIDCPFLRPFLLLWKIICRTGPTLPSELLSYLWKLAIFPQGPRLFWWDPRSNPMRDRPTRSYHSGRTRGDR